MTFFRMMKMDFKRMFLSGKFYFAIVGAMLVTVLNISQEAMQSRWNASVYYLVVSSHGVGAFFEVFSVLAVLPFALSYWEDSRNGYLRCIETRIGRTEYCWSHLVVAFWGSIISIFLGMAVVYGVLALKIPLIRKEEVETLAGSLSSGNGIVLSLYFAARFGVEAVGYAFMAVFALMISGKIKNLFVLVSTPALFYYASQLVSEVLQLPGWMRWYRINGGSIQNFKDFFVIVGYFLILTGMEGAIFVRMVKRREQNG